MDSRFAFNVSLRAADKVQLSGQRVRVGANKAICTAKITGIDLNTFPHSLCCAHTSPSDEFGGTVRAASARKR